MYCVLWSFTRAGTFSLERATVVQCNLLPDKGKLVHLLLALAFLKTYCTYAKYATDFGVSENSFTKWVWAFVRAISRMKHLVSTVLAYYYSTTYFYITGTSTGTVVLKSNYSTLYLHCTSCLCTVLVPVLAFTTVIPYLMDHYCTVLYFI